jgi:hypothetical protein
MGYQCGLRLNKFDGFSEVTAKSVLMGQYPITTIKYPHIDTAYDPKELIRLLSLLKYRMEPNPEREYWREELSKNIV